MSSFVAQTALKRSSISSPLLRTLATQASPSTETKPKPKPAKQVLAKPKAIKTPKSGSISAYNLFIQKFAEERKTSGEKYLLANARDAYTALPETEKSKLVEQIPELIKQRRAVYNEFIAKLSPSEIRDENRTRKALRKERLAAGKSVTNLGPIKDPNAPTYPATAFFLFMKARRGDAEYSNMPITESARALGHAWKELGEDGKKEYVEAAKVERDDYERKVKEYYSS